MQKNSFKMGFLHIAHIAETPLYLGNLLILIGVGIAANSLPFVLFGIPFFLFAYLAIIHAEENYLGKK